METGEALEGRRMAPSELGLTYQISTTVYIVFHTSGRVKGRTKQERTKMLNDKRNNDYSVQNDESLHGHCTDEGKVRKWDKKVRRNAI